MAILTTTHNGLNFTGGTTYIQTGTTTLMSIALDGSIAFNEYGAGYLKTDASGNITADNTAGGLPGGPYLPISAGSGFPLTGTLYIGNVGGDQKIQFQRTGGNVYSIEHDSAQLYFYNRTTTEAPLVIQNDGDVLMNAGNVGIGTTSPLNPLSIESDSSPLIKIRNTTNGGGAAIEFNDNAGSAESQNGRIKYTHVDTASQGGGSSFILEGENDQTLQVLNNGRIVVQKTGSSTEVGYGFYNDVNTGMYSPGADTIALATGGNNRLHINSSGNVGIGNTSPGAKLHVQGAVTIKGSGTGTSGSLAIQDDYDGENHLANIGWIRSSGGVYLSYGLKQEGSADWKSTFANFEGERSYMKLDNDQISIAWAPAQNTAVGTAVTGLVERFKFNLDNGVLQLNNYSAGVLMTGSTGIVGIAGSGDLPGGPYLPLASGTLTGNLTISVPDGGSAPAMSNTLFMKGYEGRGIGMKIRDSANSATNPNSREWFIGSGYSNSGFNIGYSSTGSQSSYSAQSKLNISTSGQVTIPGSVGIGITSPNEKLNVSGNILATGAIKGSSLYTNNVDQNNTTRYGNLRSEVGFSRSPISGNPEQWFKVVELNGSPKRIKFSIIATGDNTNSYDNFLISTSGYGMNMHIQKLPGGKYNTSKLLSVAAINPDNGGGVEIWIKLGPVYSGTGATYVACTSDVLASATILTSATTTAPTITGNDTQLNISNDNRNYATIQTSRGATFGDKVGIGTTSPTQKLEVVGNIRAKGDNPIIYLTSTSNPGGEEYSIQSTSLGQFGVYNGASSLLSIKSDGNVGIGTTSQTDKLDVSGTVRANQFRSLPGTYTGTSHANKWQRVVAINYSTFSFDAFKLVVNCGGDTSNLNINAEVYINFKFQNNNGRIYANIVNYGDTPLLADNFEIYRDGANGVIVIYQKLTRNYQTPSWTLIGSPVNATYTWLGNVVGTSLSGETNDAWTAKTITNGVSTNAISGNVGIGTTSPDTLLQTTNTADGTDYISYEIGNTAVNASNKGGFAIYELGTKQVTLEYYRDGSAITNLSTPYIFTIDTNSQERMRITNAGNVGIGTTDPGEKLEVSGNVKATNFILSSDASLKEDINKLNVKVDAKWKSYKFKYEDEIRYGVIAQELEETNPELVKTDDKGLKSVKYIDLLIAKIAELEARLEKAGL